MFFPVSFRQFRRRLFVAKDKSDETDDAISVPAAAGPAAQQQTLSVDDSHASAGYANFCRVSSTPEELILDLGLNPNPYAQGNVTVHVGQRIIMNHFTAKRLLSALGMALQRHEQAFGVLETDVRRRVKPSVTATMPR
jgi:hypothetical protein